MLINGTVNFLPIKSGTIQATITSPPYYRMRGYAVKDVVWGGDPDCKHVFEMYVLPGRSGGKTKKVRIKGSENFQIIPEMEQGFCINCGGWLGQYGNEPTLPLYLEHTRIWTREVWRVLKDRGTLWLNISETYSRGNDGGKPKSMLLVPFKVAEVLENDGWYVRAILPWFKRNAFASHAPDRPVISHEYVILASKSEHYDYYQEKIQGTTGERLRRSMDWFTDGLQAILNGENIFLHHDEPLALVYNNQGYKGDHFAPFAASFVGAMILASTRPGDLVLDPFMGSGSVALSAINHGRRWVGIELGWGYIQQARERVMAANHSGGKSSEGASVTPSLFIRRENETKTT